MGVGGHFFGGGGGVVVVVVVYVLMGLVWGLLLAGWESLAVVVVENIGTVGRPSSFEWCDFVCLTLCFVGVIVDRGLLLLYHQKMESCRKSLDWEGGTLVIGQADAPIIHPCQPSYCTRPTRYIVCTRQIRSLWYYCTPENNELHG